MDFGFTAYGLALAAGVLSTLSPCVLPLVPILVGSAVLAHRMGPFALAVGLGLSFALVGTLLASAGAAVGLDQEGLRNLGSAILILFGAILLLPSLQSRFAVAASDVSNAGHGVLARLTPEGLRGQFVVGLILGVVWSPCVGPTLGGAIALASQGQQLAQVGMMMGLFGLGAALPLVVLGSVSREAIGYLRGRLLAVGHHGKTVLGVLFILLGVLILSGLDKRFEAWVLQHAPQWLVELTVSI
jgi:cytochrome c biogenesis protein CcdA